MMQSQDATETEGVIDCLKRFFERYNDRDLAGMDDCLHFPHIILGVDDHTVWTERGQLAENYFEEFAAKTGWHRTVNTGNSIVCVNPNKAHVVVDYVREKVDGSVFATFSNLWILTLSDGRWGIKVRSH